MTNGILVSLSTLKDEKVQVSYLHDRRRRALTWNVMSVREGLSHLVKPRKPQQSYTNAVRGNFVASDVDFENDECKNLV